MALFNTYNKNNSLFHLLTVPCMEMCNDMHGMAWFDYNNTSELLSFYIFSITKDYQEAWHRPCSHTPDMVLSPKKMKGQEWK